MLAMGRNLSCSRDDDPASPPPPPSLSLIAQERERSRDSSKLAPSEHQNEATGRASARRNPRLRSVDRVPADICAMPHAHAGKSTFASGLVSGTDVWEWINQVSWARDWPAIEPLMDSSSQDSLGDRGACERGARDALSRGKSVIIDRYRGWLL